VSDTVEIPVEVVLEDGSVRRVFGKVEKEAIRAAKVASKEINNGLDFDNLKKSALKFAAGIVTIGTAVAVFKKAFDEAREGERVINSFNAALFSTGNFTKAASSSFIAYSESLEKTLGISKSVTLEGAKLLVTIGNLSGQGLERATKASLDLAAALGKDASTGFELISKAAAGNTEILGRYGIKLDQNIPKNERFAATLKLIESRFGGLAEQSSNTLDGALSKLNIQFGNIFENIGQLITNSPVIRKAVELVAKGFEGIAENLKGLSQLDFDKFVIGVLNFARSVSDLAIPAIEIFINAIKFLGNAFQQVFDGFVGIGTKIVAFFGKIGGSLGLVSAETVASLTEISSAATQVLADQEKKTADAFSNILNTDTSTAINERIASFTAEVAKATEAGVKFKDQVPKGFEQAKTEGISFGEAMTGVFDGFEASAEEATKNAVANFKAIGKSMLQGIGQAAGNAFSSFGKALANGENALEAFGQSLLQSFGNILVQMGSGFIFQGIAQNIAVPGSGAALISAGAALAAFGGFLSAISGPQATGSNNSSGSSSDIGGGVATSPGQTTEIEETVQEQKPNIQVVVQGNILDRRSSSLEIVDLLQEAFDTQGARVTGLA